MSSIILSDITYAHPDGTRVVSGLTATLSGKVGLVGSNGSGKTTLLRLIANELPPTSGTIRRAGAFRSIPQNLTLNTADTFARLMGIDRKLAALRAIQSGSSAAEHFDLLGDDWDLEERALATLHSLGLAENLTDASGLLERPVGTLSGGEATAAALAGAFVLAPPILLLDEPTNNLDRQSVRQLTEALNQFRGAIIAVSHDREFLAAIGATKTWTMDSLRLTDSAPPDG